MNQRQCSNCKRPIEVTRSLDGLYSYCAHCNREYHTPGRVNEKALYSELQLSEDETQEQPAVEPTLIDWLRNELIILEGDNMLIIDSPPFWRNMGARDALTRVIEYLTSNTVIVLEDTDDETR